MENLIPIILITLLLLCIAGLIHSKFEIQKCKTRMERNSAVYHYRMRVLNESSNEFDNLPSYDEMMDSDKPVWEENYVKLKQR